MNYSLYRQLLDLAEEFEAQASTTNQAAALPAFAAWLHARFTPAEHLEAVARAVPSPLENDESRISTLVVLLYRYARSYSRFALTEAAQLTFDDFTYLCTIAAKGEMSKSELITHNIHEKATGTEVIKRLLKRDYLAERPHGTDRRSKLLSLTELGQRTLFRSFEPMTKVAALVTGNLTAAERQQFSYLLHKLDAFHYPLFAGTRPATFEELLRHLPAPPEPPAQKETEL
ncbi:MAG: winged helix-turn-helix transcriptional regulator [Hymenobacter sp.]|nr:winged helix-turn-helix transcriptional regulator [Hymenobacter sp.]